MTTESTELNKNTKDGRAASRKSYLVMPEFKPGDTFKVLQYVGSPVYKCHVLAVVDGNMIVYKYYGKQKPWWHYEIKPAKELGWKIEWTKEQQ